MKIKKEENNIVSVELKCDDKMETKEAILILPTILELPISITNPCNTNIKIKDILYSSKIDKPKIFIEYDNI